MTRLVRSRGMINRTGVVIKLEGAIAPDTADREGGYTAQRKVKMLALTN
jgi:ribosomal protein L17